MQHRNLGYECGASIENKHHVMFVCNKFDIMRILMAEELGGLSWEKLLSEPEVLGPLVNTVSGQWMQRGRIWGPNLS